MGWMLAIETSGAGGGAALGPTEPGGEVMSLRLAECMRHTVELFPAIDSLLKGAGLTPGDLSAIAVSAGPGSYTGMRVGVAAAKAMAWSLGCDLVAISSLEALAREAAAADGLEPGSVVVPVVDARQGQVYWAEFQVVGGEGGGAVERLSGDQVSEAAVTAERARAGAHLFGTGVAAYRETLDASDRGFSFAEGPTWPGPEQAIEIGRRELAAGGAAGDVHAVAPSYLRPSAAETQWKERHPA